MASTSTSKNATEETDISKECVRVYKRNVIMYAVMILDSIEGKNGKEIHEYEVQDVFFKYLQMNNGLIRKELTPLHHNNSIVCQEKLTAIWGHYIFLVMTIRHPIYTPTSIMLDGRNRKIPARIPFCGITKRCREISDELNKIATDLLAVVTDAISISCGILKYMIAFSGWIALLHDVQQYNNYDTFVSSIDKWYDLKRAAELYMLLDQEKHQAQFEWPGCVAWLATMDCVTVSQRRDINRRQLFDSLPKRLLKAQTRR